MENFADYKVWGGFLLVSVLLLAVITANTLKRMIKPLHNSLIPASVLGGLILLLISFLYKIIFGQEMLETYFFGTNGWSNLEIITYHSLALGFIATTFKSQKAATSKKRLSEIFNTGITTVSTYLLQGVVGLAISIAAGMLIPNFFKAAGVLLPFGYGQGTGQALNYGNIYETDFGFTGGKSFGLSIAAMGFLSASIGGVIYLNVLKKKGQLEQPIQKAEYLSTSDIQGSNEIPMQESMDKITIQLSFTTTAYLLTFVVMKYLSMLIPGMRSVIFGFNFLLGVIIASLMKTIMRKLTKKHVIHREYINDFLMTRISNFFFDLMVVSGIAAIRINVLIDSWLVLLILGIAGLIVTFVYNRLVADKLFPEYKKEQFLMMFGMLTGTAGTGTILLREVDHDFQTPAADNMVYQNFPAIVFGFPIMLLATVAPVKPYMCLAIFTGLFVIFNIILFRSKIFGTKADT